MDCMQNVRKKEESKMTPTFGFKQLGLTKQLILTWGRQQGVGWGVRHFSWTCYIYDMLVKHSSGDVRQLDLQV